MTVLYICDGCGKREPAAINPYGKSIKPRKWYSRRDEDGEQHACSRECIKKIAERTGKTDLVLPW
ncbi:hypothetical protein AKJ59_00480 [candidate division MSBL1 archaeon SCGC-AAA385M02]|uniref:Uncharacterized protein n=1 Tax=candidate division MSBL1 archaeon SCGC-AAA385M02 TaxID=1698287 RepID=A0A133VQP8_9EURY|nr:hypothetical protein AKJ59_00480 [candidate division MSBL1 archaeon SCGC-AAA385M02]